MTIRSIKHANTLKQCHSFRHRVVRDLAWSLLTPPLFEAIPDFSPDWFKQDLVDDGVWSWLELIDKQPEMLNDHLKQQRSSRLGIYFEQLLSFYFEHYPRFTLLAKNLQVNNDERTLGEFDFIILDQADDRTKHIEAAVKFYLGHQYYQGKIKNNYPLHNWHNWVGPNQKDSLAIKMRHLQERQLPLSQTRYGQTALSSLGITDKRVESRLFIKGRFYHCGISGIDSPSFSNQNLSDNHWLETKTFFSTISVIGSEKKYCILPRNFWLSELTKTDLSSSELEVISADNLQKKIECELEQEYNEWQIAEVDLNNSKRIEVKRFFVVRNL